MESWEFRSVSSTSIARNSSLLLDMNMTSKEMAEWELRKENSEFTDEEFIRESSSNARCNGIMGVPISFLDKYCPEQFEIIWQASGNTRASAPEEKLQELGYQKHPEDRGGCTVIDGQRTYGRILIRARRKDI